MRELKNRIGTFETRLRLLGPDQVLARGYSITMDAETGKVIRESKAVEKGTRIKTKLKSGEVISTVDSSEGGESVQN